MSVEDTDLAHEVAEVLTDLRLFGELLEIKNASGAGAPTIDFGVSNWHPEQRRFERERTGFDLILKPRQIGFSTLELARDLQFALLHPSSNVLIIVHDQEVKDDFFARLRKMAHGLEALGLSPPTKRDTVNYIAWKDLESTVRIIESGSTEATAQKRARSGTIDRLHATEVGFWPAAEVTWGSLLGSTKLAREVVFESTADRAGTWFHEKVVDLQKGGFRPYKFHFYPWFEHPGHVADPAVYCEPPQTRRQQLWEKRLLRMGVSPEQLAWWRMTVGAGSLDQALREFPPTPEAAFASGSDTWLEPEHLERVNDAVRTPLRFGPIIILKSELSSLRVYVDPVEGARYVIGCDPSEGGGSDEAGIYVLDHRTAVTAAVWDSNEVKPGLLGRVVAKIGRMYNRAVIGVERNVWRKEKDSASGGGRATLKKLLTDERYPRSRVFHTEDGKPGWATSHVTRDILFSDLADGIEEGSLVTPDAKTAAELASIELVKGQPRVPRKGKGRADDGLVVAWAIALQMKHRNRIPGKVTAQVVGDELDSVSFRT